MLSTLLYAFRTRCGRCEISTCLRADSPPWSRAYTDRNVRKRFQLVLQRPSLWRMHAGTASCTCDQQRVSPEELSAPGVHPGDFGSEELVDNHPRFEQLRHGCCAPTRADMAWLTRSLRCVFPRRCDAKVIRLDSIGVTEHINVTRLDAGPRGVAVCVPRVSAAVTRRTVRRWLQHHTALGVMSAWLYSDELNATSLARLEFPASGRHDVRPTSATPSARLVDIRGLREYNGWYHHQMLAMRDCLPGPSHRRPAGRFSLTWMSSWLRLPTGRVCHGWTAQK